MLLSMTGYGKSKSELNKYLLEVEIKSVNSSKGLDINLKIPNLFKDKENDIKNLIYKDIYRGKVDFYINISSKNLNEKKNFTINTNLVQKYISDLKNINSSLLESEYLKIAIKMPDVLDKNICEENDEISDSEWQEIKHNIELALFNFNEFRKQEGEKLKCDLIKNINSIKTYSEQIKKFIPERIEKIKNNIISKIENLKLEVDNNRLEQEIIYYIEKIDINEEEIRLTSHLDYFITEINNTKEFSKGKKLNFICQEIGREINTLGNKSNHIEIQKIVVNMKDELEKIKEQCFNIL